MNQVFQRSTISSKNNSARRNSNSNVSFSSSTFESSFSTSTYSATPVTQHPAPTASLKPERPQRSRVVPSSSSSSSFSASALSVSSRWNENQPPLSASQLNFTSNSLLGNATDDDVTDDEDDSYNDANYESTELDNRSKQEHIEDVRNRDFFYSGRPLTNINAMAPSSLFSSTFNSTSSSSSPRQSLKSSLAQAAEAANAAAASVVGAVANLNMRRGIQSTDGDSSSNLKIEESRTSFDVRPNENLKESAFALLEKLGAEAVVSSSVINRTITEGKQALPLNDKITVPKATSYMPTIQSSEDANHSESMSSLKGDGVIAATYLPVPQTQSSPTQQAKSPENTVSPDAKALVSHLARVVQHQNHLEAELRATQKRLSEVERLNATVSEPLSSSSSPSNSLKFSPRPSVNIDRVLTSVESSAKSSPEIDDNTAGSLLTITDTSVATVTQSPAPPPSSSLASSSLTSSSSTSGLLSLGGGMLRVSRSLASVALSPTGRTVSSHLQHRLHVTAQHLQRQLSELQTKSTIAANEAAEREASLMEAAKLREEEWHDELEQLLAKAREEGRVEGAEAVRLSSNLSRLENENEMLRNDLKLTAEKRSLLEQEKAYAEEVSAASNSLLQAELQAARNATTRLSSEIEHLHAKLEGSTTRCNELEALIGTSSSDQQQLQHRVNEQKIELQDLRSVLIAGNSELDEAINDRDTLKKELEAVRDLYNTQKLSTESSEREYNAELARYRNEAERFATTLENVRLEASSKSDAEIMALRRDDQETISELMGIVAALKTRRIETERLLSDSKSREAVEKTRADTAEKQLSDLQTLSSEIKEELKSVAAIHSTCAANEGLITEEYSRKLEAKEVELKTLYEDNQKLSVAVKNLQQELDSKEIMYASKFAKMEGVSVASQTSPLPAPGILSPRKLDEIKDLETEVFEGRLQRMAISAQLEAARDAHESALRDNDELVSKFNDDRQSLQSKLDSLATISGKPNPAITAAAVAHATSHLRKKLLEKNSALMQAVSAAEQAATAAEEAEKMEREVHNMIPLLRSLYESRLRTHGVPVPSDDEINEIFSRGSTDIGLSTNDAGSIDGSPRSTISAPPTGTSSASSRRSQRLDQLGDVSFRQLLGSTFGSLSHSIASSSFPSPLEASPSNHSAVNISDTRSVLLSENERKRHSRSIDLETHTSSTKPGFVSPETPLLFDVNHNLPTSSSVLNQPRSTGSDRARSLHFSPNSPIGTSSLESLAALPMNEFTSPFSGQSSVSASTPFQSLEDVMMKALAQGLNADETSKILQDALGVVQSSVSPSPYQPRGAAAAKLGLRKGGISQLRSPE